MTPLHPHIDSLMSKCRSSLVHWIVLALLVVSSSRGNRRLHVAAGSAVMCFQVNLKLMLSSASFYVFHVFSQIRLFPYRFHILLDINFPIGSSLPHQNARFYSILCRNR
ncbi:hypothetical protein QBC45DRAFT_410402 [Copromyces sp. CBS 386.78]|nr:hypothetical protein QBC45DRAFT_410402 [Copromyces sp. CBS 386.78]